MDAQEQRRLLELAAKAAGIKIDKSPYNGGGRGNNGFDVCGNAVLDWHNGVTWNPLEDDGDALRLAVKLGIELAFTRNKIGAGRHSTASYLAWANEDRKVEDPFAATRRAIVRAAAAIGEKMEEEE